ncbi:hypothetical protein [Gordonia hydrophobica]|uniref:MmpS family membrane protein n=1 Tax=Gordonia hydrophobica TaxID=40516 RepID=A0ABZ2U4D8_9ACTN|nr:hypothetical protein [Gordonia hydrophobica]MBM7368299.1 hypothetical protein [Gordonia hydrophobica]
MVDRSTPSTPDYRPPLAVGQVYPALGYSADGAPMFTYDDRERVLAGPQPAPPPPPPVAPPTAPPEPPNRWNLAIGLASVVVLVLLVAVGVKTFGGHDDAPVSRADPPATQSTDDPYLEGLPSQPESSVPRDPEVGQRPGQTGSATVVYRVESGPATLLYFEGDRIRMDKNTSGTWTKTVRGSQTTLLRVSVILSTDDPASCSITVDGKTVVSESSETAATSGLLTCQFRG